MGQENRGRWSCPPLRLRRIGVCSRSFSSPMGLVVSGGPTSQEPHFAAAPRATLVSVSMFPVKPKHTAGQQ